MALRQYRGYYVGDPVRGLIGGDHHDQNWRKVADAVAALETANTFLVAADDASADVKAAASYVCDGTQDEVQINAAITALNAAGGGVVQLSLGTFQIDDSIMLLSDITLRGYGWRTRLVFEDHATSHAMIRNAAGAATSDDSWTSAGNENINLLDFYIDGNKSGQTGYTYEPRMPGGVGNFGCIALAYVTNFLVQGLRIDNAWAAGVEMEFSSAGWVVDNRIDNSADDCIACNMQSYNIVIARNIVSNPGWGKFYGSPNGIEVQDGSYNIAVFANTIFNLVNENSSSAISLNSHDVGLYGEVHHVAVQGNVVENCRLGMGIRDETRDFVVNGNTISMNVQTFLATEQVATVAPAEALGAYNYVDVDEGGERSYTLNSATGAVWYMWYDGASEWYISEVIGTPGARYWTTTDAGALATGNVDWTSAGTATGTIRTTQPSTIGINLSTVNNFAITNNVLQMNEGNAVGMKPAVVVTDGTISGNQFSGTKSTALQNVADLARVVICDNVFRGGTSAYACVDLDDPHDYEDVSIHDNVVSNTTYGFWIRSSGSTYARCSFHHNIAASDVSNPLRSYAAADVDIPAGWNIYDNVGFPSRIERREVMYKNTSGATLSDGDVVIMKVTGGNDVVGMEIGTTETAGDHRVLGVVAETIANDADGIVQTLGKCTLCNVEGTANVAINNPLTIHGDTPTSKAAMLASSGECVFAIAWEEQEDNSVVQVPVWLIGPRQMT